jgi:hypothetical protein
MKIRAAVVALAFVAVSSTAQAQGGYWWGGLGLAMPMGDAADAVESGLIGSAGIGWNLRSMKNWSFQVEGLMSNNAAKVGSADISMLGLLGNLSYEMNAEAKTHPYFFGGLGFMSSKAKGGSSVSDMAWQVGGGLSFKANNVMNLWADVRYLNVMSTTSMTYLPITVGFAIPWGTQP